MTRVCWRIGSQSRSKQTLAISQAHSLGQAWWCAPEEGRLFESSQPPQEVSTLTAITKPTLKCNKPWFRVFKQLLCCRSFGSAQLLAMPLTLGLFSCACYSLNCVFTKIHTLKASPPVPQNVTLFGNRMFLEIIKRRSLGWVLVRTSVLIKSGHLDSEMQTGTLLSEYKKRDKGDASTS